MDFSAGGTLYAAVNIAGDGGTGSDHLAILDKTTGAATVIGPFGTCTGVTIPSDGGGSCTIEGIEAIAFDASGTLWGARSARGAAGAPGLYTINTSNRRSDFRGPDSGRVWSTHHLGVWSASSSPVTGPSMGEPQQLSSRQPMAEDS